MKIFEFIKKEDARKEIYVAKPTISINDMFMVKKYVPYAEKVGIAIRTLSSNYADQYDYINGKIHLAYEFLKIYSDLEFDVADDEEIDVDGLYDFIVSSGCMGEIQYNIGTEWREVNEILLSLVKMKNREVDIKDPIADFLESVESKNPEDVEKMTEQIQELMKDENVKNMINFKNRADK